MKRQASTTAHLNTGASLLTRRQLLTGAAAGTAALLLPHSVRAKRKKPYISPQALNVLLVVAGGERSWDRLPSYLHVPARERMLQRSVEFGRFYAASPTPAPALAAMLSGHHGPRNGVTDSIAPCLFGTELSPRVPCLAVNLRERGWHTAYFGDWNLSAIDGPRPRSDQLDRFGYSWSSLPPQGLAGELSDRRTTREAVIWLRTRATTLRHPWLATVYLNGPAVALQGAQGRAAKTDVLASAYEEAVTASDAQLGSILDALDESGRKSDTLIVYTSDCGTLLGEHDRTGNGPYVYEEVVHVPLLIDHPDGPGAVRSEALVSSVDLLTTIVELAHTSHATVLQTAGHSVAQNLFIPRAKSRRDRTAHGALVTHSALSRIDIDRTPPQTAHDTRSLSGIMALLEAARTEERGFYRAIIDGRYKMARYFAPSDHHRPSNLSQLRRRNDLALYDLKQDPDERLNAAARGESPDRNLLTRLHEELDALVLRELSDDDGSYLPGPAFLWRA